jgi:ABC-2 type transport system ATP-binding protein
MSTTNEVPVIDAASIGKSFDDTVAVRDVSFSVGEGEVFSLLGPNGAGKTTVVRMLTTLTGIGEGSARIAGRDVATEPHEVRKVIGVAGQAAAVDEKLTVIENLNLFSRLYKLPSSLRRKRVAELVERFDMGSFANRPAATFSGGQRRRLDIVAALVAQPRALFLDEPTTGLDPRSRSELWDSVRELAAEGTAILLTTQYLEEADALADRIQVIDRGRTVASGTPASLKKSVGLDVLQITVATEGDLGAATAALTDMDGVTVDAEAKRIDVAISEGAAQSLHVLRRLQDRDATIADFELRKPTLDDAFLALTGSSIPEPVPAMSQEDNAS